MSLRATSSAAENNYPLAYFLTWTTYGSRLHGDDRGTVDREHNAYDSPGLGLRPTWVDRDAELLRFAPVILDDRGRSTVDEAIRRLCIRNGWGLHALNVRTNHVHAVVAAPLVPERVLAGLKAWATRALADSGIAERRRKLWTRHGSTRYLWTEADIANACTYVALGQD